MNAHSLSLSTIVHSLNRDFGEDLSDRMVVRNMKKCSLDVDYLDKDSYFRLIGSIISDYSEIRPLGCDIILKTKELLSAVDS